MFAYQTSLSKFAFENLCWGSLTCVALPTDRVYCAKASTQRCLMQYLRLNLVKNPNLGQTFVLTLSDSQSSRSELLEWLGRKMRL